MNLRVSVRMAVVAASLCAAALFPCSRVHADDTGPTWELRPAIDVPVIVLGLVPDFAWRRSGELARPWCAPRCNPDSLFVLDRPFAGRYSAAWHTVGDVSVTTLFAGAFLTLALDEGFLPALSDAVVVAESVVAAGGFTALVQLASRRPRPYMYGDDAPESLRNDPTSALSFPSGHTTTAFAAATALWRTVATRHPGSVLSWVVFGVGLAGASFVGVSRMLAGRHFPTDTLFGAAVGISTGMLVTELHRSRIHVGVTATPEAAAVSLTGAF